MALNSVEFLIFLPVAALVYYTMPQKIRPAWLLVVSICFYLFSGPNYILWLAIAIGSSYSAGLVLNKKKSRVVLAVGIILNVGILCTFKFFRKALPMGISFFTFQVIGYMIDVYRGKMHAEKNLLYYALFVSFFHISLRGL